MDPPQPMVAAATIRTNPRQAMSPMLPAVHFLLAITRGNRRIGNSTSAVATPGRVSEKTTVMR